MVPLKRLAISAMLATVGVASCGETDLPEPAGFSFAPVFLLDIEQLEPPAVDYGDVYKPAGMYDIDESDPSVGRYTGFFVTLAAKDPGAVRLRLHDLETMSRMTFQQVTPPTADAQRPASSEPRTFNATTRDSLSVGTGVYWLAGSGGDGTELQYRFAVLVPESLLSPFTRLEMFTDSASDGTAIGAAQIELVRDFFYVAILGDSVQWGNGLKEEDKISTLVTEVIERETGMKVIQQRYAQTGARIVPAEEDSVCEVNCSGEVPTASTSITLQVDLIQRPDLIDFILMDGCINDIDIAAIIDPNVSEEELTEPTVQFCRDEMTTLLRKARSVAPRARIVVTGYFQMVSYDSDPFALRQWARTRELELDEEDLQFIDVMAEHSILFRDLAHESLRAAVDAVNADTDDQDLVAFADPGFGRQNAVFAEDPWLWSMTSETELLGDVTFELELFPEDPIQGFRLESCFEPDVVGNFIVCLYASVGHPNPTGAQAYGDVVVEALRDLGVLPATPTGE